MRPEDDDEEEEEGLYAVTFPRNFDSGVGGPEVATIEQLVITRKGREHLKSVPIDADHAALIVGWYEDRVKSFVSFINEHYDELPDPPPYLDHESDLTPL